jgi:hypothetical protein
MLVSLEEVEMVPVPPDADGRPALQRLTHLVERLKPEDREVILAYLEGMEAAEIGELTGICQEIWQPRFIGSRIFWRGTSTSQDTMPNELNPEDPRNPLAKPKKRERDHHFRGNPAPRAAIRAADLAAKFPGICGGRTP